MRIAMMTNNYKPFIGGVPISIERLANGLRTLGNEVYIFAPEYGSMELTSKEPWVIRCKSFKKKKGEYVVPNVFSSDIFSKFKALNIDLIHVHHPILMGNVAKILGAYFHIPVVFTYHTRYEEYLHNIGIFNALQKMCKTSSNSTIKNVEQKVMSVFKEKVLNSYIRGYMNSCQMVFAPTKDIEKHLKISGVTTDIRVVPTGISAEYFEEDDHHKQRIRKKYIEHKKYLFCTVCRLSKEKNLFFLLNGLHQLKKQIGDCFKLMLIGDGPLKSELISLTANLGLQDNVIFINSVDNNDIGEYYRSSDLFLFSSKSETQGIVILEAMAAKIPVVAVNGTGIVDVVENKINGFITGEDVYSWSEKIALLVTNDELRSAMCQGAYRTSQKYKTTSIAQMVENYYKTSIDECGKIHGEKEQSQEDVYESYIGKANN